MTNFTQETTTNLEKLKNGAKYTWGEVIAIHEIGEYAVIESYGHEFVNQCSTGRIDYSTKEYHGYLNGKAIGRSTHSMDSTLAECIAYKHDGCNSQAAHFFIKMIAKAEGEK